jgi:hypothetical protein
MTKSSIPKIIWQTYKDDLDGASDQLKKCVNSWVVNNKGYEHRYYNDYDAGQLILKDYGPDWYDLFNTVPLGVIRADIFRYLVIYKYGGIYSDIDTVCKIPIDNWITGPDKYKKDYSAIFAAEIVGKDILIGDRICQWTFAATPNHPIFKNIVDNVYNALKTIKWDEVTDMVEAIHYVTGPNIFSYSVLSEMGFASFKNGKYYSDPKLNLCTNSGYINNSEYSLKNNVYIYGEKHLGFFNMKAVRHMYGGSNEEWAENNKNYVQWKKEAKNIL